MYICMYINHVRFVCIYGLDQLNGLIGEATSMLQSSLYSFFMLIMRLDDMCLLLMYFYYMESYLIMYSRG